MRRELPLPDRAAAVLAVASTSLWLLQGVLAVPAAWATDPARRISQYAHTAWRVQGGHFKGVPHVLAQTADGYLWIGTEAGLVRFDGVRFVPWEPPPDSPLPSPNVYSLLAARDGGLWIGTGRSVAHWSHGRLTTFPDLIGRINALHEDADGAVWLVRSRLGGTLKGPLCRVGHGDERCYGAADSIDCQNAGALASDARGNLWFGGSDGLCRWRSGDGATYLQHELAQVEGLAGVHAVAVGKDGEIWIGVPRAGPGLGLQRFAGGAWTSAVAPDLDGRRLEVTALLVDRDQALWIGTMKEGVYRLYQGRTERFAAADGLSSDSVDSFFQDREGNVWVATSKGIDKFRDFRVTTFSVREGLTADRVSAVVAAHDGAVWVGNQGALDVLRDGVAHPLTAKDGLPGTNVTSLFEDHAGRMWVGVDSGLAVYDGRRFRSVRRRNGQPVGIVTAIAEDTDHDIWIMFQGQPRGLMRIRDFEVREELLEPAVPSIHALATDPGGGLWLGLVGGGLARYRHGQLERFQLHAADGGGAVLSLIVDADGAVWGATRQRGVARWKNGILRVLGTGNGLPCDRVFSLARDLSRALWVYTACGLVAIPDSELVKWWNDPTAIVSLKTFDVLDGLQPGRATFNPQISRSPDGRLWFANDSVLQAIDPADHGRPAAAPAVHIEQVVADRRRYESHEVLRLPALTRDIQLEYTATSFAIPERVQFRHILEGYDREWREARTARQAEYSNLPPGTYAFRVVASDRDGLWHWPGAALTIVVPPAWFQTHGFRAMCAASAILVGWAIHRLRLRRMALAMSGRFDERLAERTAIARELHDTLLQTIQASKMVADHALDRAGDTEHARCALGQLSRWLGQAVQEGRAALHSLRRSAADESDLVASLRDVAEDARPSPCGPVVLSVDGAARSLHPVVREEVFRIAHEAIRNARAHAQASRLRVEIRFADDLMVRVADDGIGIDPAVVERGTHGHYGVLGMHERAARIGGRLTVVRVDPSGTAITLIVPGRIAYGKPGQRFP